MLLQSAGHRRQAVSQCSRSVAAAQIMGDHAPALAAVVDALYGGSGPDQAQANSWLNAFSNQPAAWDAGLALLDPARPEQTRFFCANMLLTKARKEWHRLPGDRQAQLGAAIRCGAARPALWRILPRPSRHSPAGWPVTPLPPRRAHGRHRCVTLLTPQRQVQRVHGHRQQGRQARVRAPRPAARGGRRSFRRRGMPRLRGALHGTGSGSGEQWCRRRQRRRAAGERRPRRRLDARLALSHTAHAASPRCPHQCGVQPSLPRTHAARSRPRRRPSAVFP